MNRKWIRNRPEVSYFPQCQILLFVTYGLSHSQKRNCWKIFDQWIISKSILNSQDFSWFLISVHSRIFNLLKLSINPSWNKSIMFKHKKRRKAVMRNLVESLAERRNVQPIRNREPRTDEDFSYQDSDGQSVDPQ